MGIEQSEQRLAINSSTLQHKPWGRVGGKKKLGFWNPEKDQDWGLRESQWVNNGRPAKTLLAVL